MTSNLSLNSFLNGMVALTTTNFLPLEEELGDLFNFLNHFPFVVLTGVDGTSLVPVEEEDLEFEDPMAFLEVADPMPSLEDEEGALEEDLEDDELVACLEELFAGGGLEEGSEVFEVASFCFFAAGLESSFFSSVWSNEAALFFDLQWTKGESRT